MADIEMLQAIGQMLDTKLQPVHERLDRMDERLDGIDERLDRMDERLDGIDERLDRMDERLDGIDERLDGIEVRLERLEVRVDCVEKRLSNLEEQVSEVSTRVKRLELIIENEIKPRLNTIEECYLSTFRRYSEYSEKMKNAFVDIDILKKTVQRHSMKLQSAT